MGVNGGIPELVTLAASSYFMGLTDLRFRHAQHSMVLVPMDSPGCIERMLPVMNMYDEPYGHGEVVFGNVIAQEPSSPVQEGFEMRRAGSARPGAIACDCWGWQNWH